ncbi:MAG: hypothetical protein ACRDTD_22725 [Pseudonocardiaceae bacterium]
MAYNNSPDGPPATRLDPEIGTNSTPAAKPAGYRTATSYDDRARERDSARDLDRMVEVDGAQLAARNEVAFEQFVEPDRADLRPPLEQVEVRGPTPAMVRFVRAPIKRFPPP